MQDNKILIGNIIREANAQLEILSDSYSIIENEKAKDRIEYVIHLLNAAYYKIEQDENKRD